MKDLSDLICVYFQEEEEEEAVAFRKIEWQTFRTLRRLEPFFWDDEFSNYKRIECGSSQFGSSSSNLKKNFFLTFWNFLKTFLKLFWNFEKKIFLTF